MNWITWLLILFVNASAVRISVRKSGRTPDISVVWMCIALMVATKSVGWALSPMFCAYICKLYLSARSSRHKVPSPDKQPLALVESILQRMCAGVAFESAWHGAVTGSELSAIEMKSAESQEVFRYCRENPSLAFRVLENLRSTLVLTQRLERKQSNITLQARAQGLVCCGLYLLVFAFQIYANELFREFLSTSRGLAFLFLSAFLCGGGVAAIFRMARFKMEEL